MHFVLLLSTDMFLPLSFLALLLFFNPVKKKKKMFIFPANSLLVRLVLEARESCLFRKCISTFSMHKNKAEELQGIVLINTTLAFVI